MRLSKALIYDLITWSLSASAWSDSHIVRTNSL